MLDWFKKLMPKEEKFFDYFERHAKTIVEGAKAMRQLHGAGSAGLGYGYDHINFRGRQSRDHPLGQGFAQVQSRLVNRNAIHGRVRPGQVNVLKNTRGKHSIRNALTRVKIAVQVNVYRFTRMNITHKIKA